MCTCSNLLLSARLDIIYRKRPDPPTWVYNIRTFNTSNYIHNLTKHVITNTTNVLCHHLKSQLARAHSALSQLSAPQTWQAGEEGTSPLWDCDGFCLWLGIWDEHKFMDRPSEAPSEAPTLIMVHTIPSTQKKGGLVPILEIRLVHDVQYIIHII